jgi:hypothetical protein
VLASNEASMRVARAANVRLARLEPSSPQASAAPMQCEHASGHVSIGRLGATPGCDRKHASPDPFSQTRILPAGHEPPRWIESKQRTCTGWNGLRSTCTSLGVLAAYPPVMRTTGTDFSLLSALIRA